VKRRRTSRLKTALDAAALAAWVLRRRKPVVNIRPLAAPADDGHVAPARERRSGRDRRVAERRRSGLVAASPVTARIEAAMDRRSGADRRSGRDRRV